MSTFQGQYDKPCWACGDCLDDHVYAEGKHSNGSSIVARLCAQQTKNDSLAERVKSLESELRVERTSFQRNYSESQKKVKELEARVDEEAQNYVDMMDLRDAEIRKISKLEVKLYRAEKVIEAARALFKTDWGNESIQAENNISDALDEFDKE
jgi:flagellar biosynthesis GTPase FlhF